MVAVQRRHVKMYSPRKTWESSQPYGWQASRALEDLKGGRAPIGNWISLLLLLCSVGCIKSLKVSEGYIHEPLIHVEWVGAIKFTHKVDSLTKPPMYSDSPSSQLGDT
jgi:hypothetical protein